MKLVVENLALARGGRTILDGMSFTVLLDVEREVFKQYFIRGVPTTYFINRKGIIQSVTIGAFANIEEIEKNLNKITSGS